MSEQIKIAVVMHDEKPNGRYAAETAEKITLTQESGMTLMPVLLKSGLMDGSFCGGRGDCGRCVVQFLKGAPFPTGLERSRLKPEELRQGFRLACVVRPKADCIIRIVNMEDIETPIVTNIDIPSENIDFISQWKRLSENRESTDMKFHVKSKMGLKNRIKKSSVIEIAETDDKCGPGKSTRYIIAVDLGTTTVAMQLRDVVSGAVADTYCEKNPQRRYGMDVLARIQASVDGQGEELRKLACSVILRGLRQFAKDLQGEIVCMCVAGNTAMEHLLLGYDVTSLGKAPFVPVKTGLQKMTATHLFEGFDDLTEDFSVYIAPCISAFVGGDIVAGLYTLGLLSLGTSENDEREEGSAEVAFVTDSSEADNDRLGKELTAERRAVLFIDLGTNGEMVITDGRRMIVTATAAGPAFEGDGIMIGTDRIALTAQLLREGILDETGLLSEPYFTEGVCVERGEISLASGDQRKKVCYLKQSDIRALQMAKAAVRAGVEILWEEMGRPEIGQVFLAGGFGYYLDVEAAFSIGLLPVYMRGKVQAVGNTSLAGAYELGRDLYGRRADAVRTEAWAGFAQSVNLAETEQFEEFYLKYMNLGEN